MPKLAINQPGDKYEQEADRVADQVMRMTDTDVLQRKCAKCEEEEEGKKLRRKESSPSATPPVAPPIVHEVINSPGRPLDTATRAFFEPRFGADLSHVRLHSDETAAQSAADVEAKAYTAGNHIVFGRAGDSQRHFRLLAHELTHVLQQSHSTGDRKAIQRKEDKPKERKKAELKERFESEGAAKIEVKRLEDLGIEGAEIQTRGKEYIILFYRITKTKDLLPKVEAKQKTLGEGLKAGTAYDEKSASHYVTVYLTCPEGVTPKAGYFVWLEDFNRGDAAKDNATKKAEALKASYGEAEVLSREGARGYCVSYRPISEKAQDKFRSDAEKQLESDKTQAPLKECPKGYRSKGKFLLTTYFLPLERDYGRQIVKKNPCGLQGEYSDEFLAAVVLQGSGVSNSGQYVRVVGENKNRDVKRGDTQFCYALSDCPTVKLSKTCAAPGRTAAVDKKIIGLGKELLIDGVGSRIAEDTGEKIKGRHIDVYRGALKKEDANLLTLKDKLVCEKG